MLLRSEPMPAPASVPMAAPVPAPWWSPASAPATVPIAAPARVDVSIWLLAASRPPGPIDAPAQLRHNWSSWMNTSNGLFGAGIAATVGPDRHRRAAGQQYCRHARAEKHQ